MAIQEEINWTSPKAWNNDAGSRLLETDGYLTDPNLKPPWKFHRLLPRTSKNADFLGMIRMVYKAKTRI